MEPKVIIQILEKAKVFTVDKELYDGLCHTIRNAYACVTGNDYNPFLRVSDVIPEFTRANAINYADADIHASVYWWKVSDIDNRIKFLDWLIETYKNKLYHGSTTFISIYQLNCTEYGILEELKKCKEC